MTNRNRNGIKTILNDQKVLAIRKAFDEGSSSATLSEEYGVAYATIHSIVKGRTWKHLLKPTTTEECSECTTLRVQIAELEASNKVLLGQLLEKYDVQV